MENAGRIRSIFRKINPESFQSLRIRVHGDYHLGQLLYDGNDYTILDFEGEPESSIHDRKIRHSGLKDVAGMLRSFHYAVSAKLYFSTGSSMLSSEALERAVIKWYDQIKKSFLDAYWKIIRENEIYQAPEEELEYLLNFHLLEKAVYELGYELNARPTWVKIPLKGIQQVLNEIDLS